MIFCLYLHLPFTKIKLHEGENYDDPDNKSASLSLKSIYLLFKERCILTRKHLKALHDHRKSTRGEQRGGRGMTVNLFTKLNS